MTNLKLTDLVKEKTRHIPALQLDQSELCFILNHALALRDDRMLHSYNDISNLNTKLLAELITALYASTPEMIEQNIEEWKSKVALADYIKKDFESFDCKFYWGNIKMLVNDLIIRSISGHAESGHCEFKYRGKFTNTTTADVVQALIESRNIAGRLRNRYLRSFADNSQLQINSIVECLDSYNFYNHPNNPCFQFKNRKKKPLCGLEFLTDFNADLIEAWRGFYYTTNMDNYNIRRLVKKKYGFELGGGEVFPVDINKLKEYNIGICELSSAEYKIPFLNEMEPYKRLELFKEMGIIIDNGFSLDKVDFGKVSWQDVVSMGVKPSDYHGREVRNAYIRIQKGKGIADDIAIMLSAFLPSTFRDTRDYAESKSAPMSRMVAAFLGDRIDTIDKDSTYIIPGGQDEAAGAFINNKFRLLCRDKEFRIRHNIMYRCDGQYDLINEPALVDFVAAAAIMDYKIHCSQRYFLMAYTGASEPTCALNEEFRFVKSYAHTLGRSITTLHQGKGYDPNMEIGFHRIPLRTVVSETRKRLNMVLNPCKREKSLSEFYSRL